ncbi:MAG: hypothetical protein JXQ73_19115 [Phycisphaerae bacterium]|nr:hypothetical protein [Phycisphaerae bacterium]
MTTGCRQPTAKPNAFSGRADEQPAPEWSDGQRRQLRSALKVAHEDVYQQLRKVRLRGNEKLERLIRDRTSSTEEFRNLAASSEITRVTWLPDGRCRVAVRLGMVRVADAVRRWDCQGKWRPHRQIIELNENRALYAVATSEGDPGRRQS